MTRASRCTRSRRRAWRRSTHGSTDRRGATVRALHFLNERRLHMLCGETSNYACLVPAVVNGANHNLQRPETVETLMYLWRVTKKRKWRDAGWEIMQAFNRCCKIESGGYVGLRDVTNAVRRNKPGCFVALWRCVAHGRSCGYGRTRQRTTRSSRSGLRRR